MNFKELFDYKDGALYWKVNRNTGIKRIGLRAGSTNTIGYRQVLIDGKKYAEHRIIYAMHNDEIPAQIDHINGNRADNRIENLRPANNQQNQHNSKLRSDNKSGIKGVTWHKASKKWAVNLRVNGVLKSFGLYFDIDYAKFVADAMRHKYHKEFANHG